MPFEYFRPASLEEAWRLWTAHRGARFVAGGTDLLVRIRKKDLPPPPALISLRRIPELRGVEIGDGRGIGAMTTLAEGVEHRGLRDALPALAAAARSIGGAQIRSVATFGGNLCNASPCADLAPPLLTYEAQLEIRSPRGARRVPAEEFFRGPGETRLEAGEILTAILVAVPPPGTRAVYLRQSRVGMDLALASVAVRLELDGNRCRRAWVAAGAVAPTPVRLPVVEALLTGSPITEALLTRVQATAAAAVAPISDIRASADHRRRIVGAFVRRAVERLAGPSAA